MSRFLLLRVVTAKLECKLHVWFVVCSHDWLLIPTTDTGLSVVSSGSRALKHNTVDLR